MNRRFLPPRWLLAMTILIVAVILGLFTMFSRPAPDLLATLPHPGADVPWTAIRASRAEFPLHAVRFFSDSATISPGGVSPVSSLLPLFEGAEQAALVAAERPGGLAMYGAFAVPKEETALLSAGKIPERWDNYLENPELHATERENILQLRALNVAAPLYISVHGRTAYIADSAEDMEGVRRVLSRTEKGMEPKWSVEPEWGGHMRLFDGGRIAASFSASPPAATRHVIELEIAWRTRANGTPAPLSLDMPGEARWRVYGLENLVARSILKNLRPADWTGMNPFIPDPLILSCGVNLPNPGRNFASFPFPFRNIAEELRRIGLRPAEVQKLFTGPAIFSVGGRTEILWFELPGIVADLPNRGKAATKLIAKFWSELFAASTLQPVPGYPQGGATASPFTVMAVANEEKAVVGLTTPDALRNADIPNLLKELKSATGWLYLDLPMLASSMAEIPAIDSIFQDLQNPVDEESADRLQKTMNRLGHLFVVWETAATGRAVWYY